MFMKLQAFCSPLELSLLGNFSHCWRGALGGLQHLQRGQKVVAGEAEGMQLTAATPFPGGAGWAL